MAEHVAASHVAHDAHSRRRRRLAERLALVGQPSREKAGRSPAQARNGKTGTDALDYTLARLGESARERASTLHR